MSDKKRVRSDSLTAAAELLVLKKCARLLENVLKGNGGGDTGGLPQGEIELLAPELDWVIRKVEGEALVGLWEALTPEIFSTNGSLLRHFCRGKWNDGRAVTQVILTRAWNAGPPYLSFAARFERQTDSGEYEFDGFCLYGGTCNPRMDMPSTFTDIESILKQRDKPLQDVLGDLVQYQLEKKRLTVYSSNEELFRVFDRD
jgi:hypothetical protein